MWGSLGKIEHLLSYLHESAATEPSDTTRRPLRDQTLAGKKNKKNNTVVSKKKLICKS